MPGVQENPIYFVTNQNIVFNNNYTKCDLADLHPCKSWIP
jgi:hypothetical protein